MSEESKVFYRRHSKTGEDVDDKFDVEINKNTKIILILLFVGFFLAAELFPLFDGVDEGLIIEWWAPIVFCIMTIPAILLWGKLGPAIAEKLTMKWLQKVSAKKVPAPTDIVLGFPMATKDPYFIESNPMDFDISKPAIFLNRVKDAIFLSVGLSILISQLVLGNATDLAADQVAKWDYVNEYEMIIYSAIFLGPFALIVLFFVLPLMWISEDMQIYRVDALQDVYKVGFYVKTGPLSKILSFFGIILAFNTANNFASDLYAADGPSVIYYWTFMYFIFILLGCSIYPLLCAIVYLLLFHKEWVNRIRIKASEFIPCASMQVNYAPANELEYLTHPEKLAEFDKPDFSDTMKGKIIIFSLVIVVVILSFWFAFIY